MLASAIVSAIAMVVIMFVTSYYAVVTKRLWEINKRLWELSRDTALCSYAVNYLTSFVQRLREDKLRETYMSAATKIVYDTLDELLSSETADKLGKFRRDVDAKWTAKLAEIKQKREEGE